MLRSLFERNSTQSNIRGIEGGTISIYSTRKLAIQGFLQAMDIGMVHRVSVVHVREVMTEDDFPGLIEPWRF